MNEDELYHYDPLHHELVLIKSGNIFNKIMGSLSVSGRSYDCDFAIIVTNMLDKNSFKYGTMSYRIQTIDSGVFIRRVIEIAPYFRIDPEYHLDFDDDIIASELCIGDEEGVMGVITIRDVPLFHFGRNDKNLKIPKTNLDLNRSKYFPLLKLVHEQTKPVHSKWRDKESFHSKNISTKSPTYFLPNPRQKNMSLEQYMAIRNTTFHYFSGEEVSQEDFSSFLGMAFEQFNPCYDFHYRAEIAIYCYCNHIKDIKEGLYIYNVISHSLTQVWEGALSLNIYKTIVQPDLDFNKTAATLILSGLPSFMEECSRLYRKTNIVCGIMMERIIHSAVIQGLGQYPFLSYSADAFKTVMKLPEPFIPLSLIFIGHKDCSNYILKYPMFL
ncbi:SagB-type dehydrogenase domain protein [Paenibacillus larvae subsp. larvae]|nr:SagB-type dehydrogenase domain protein [Paenibacillus larvae subsp. larvae]AVF31789.1 SagB-type dehydrogenase domain protein [Paenibacillus larvae subsp. larvae]